MALLSANFPPGTVRKKWNTLPFWTVNRQMPCRAVAPLPQVYSSSAALWPASLMSALSRSPTRWYGASHEPVPYEPPATGIEVGKTEWTAIGLVFLVLLLGILGVREAISARLGPAAGRRLRPLTIAAIPLLIGFALVVLERFMSVI